MSTRSLYLLAAVCSRRFAHPVERLTVGGLPALTAYPVAAGPTLVFANAATPLGIEAPGVARFLGGVARAGFHAVAPELPHVRSGRVTPATVDALVRVVEAVEGPVVLAGGSTGAGLAVIAAADDRIVGRVALVSAIAPFADLGNVLRLATTGHYVDDDGALRAYRVAPLLRWVAATSLRAAASGPATETLLGNRDPERFDELFAALPAEARATVEALSPVRALPRVRAPVDIVCEPNDVFFPLAEARALAGAGARLTVTPALSHVRPRMRLGLGRLVGFLDRMLLLEPAFAA